MKSRLLLMRGKGKALFGLWRMVQRPVTGGSFSLSVTALYVGPMKIRGIWDGALEPPPFELLHLNHDAISKPGRVIHGEANYPVGAIPVSDHIHFGPFQCLKASRSLYPSLMEPFPYGQHCLSYDGCDPLCPICTRCHRIQLPLQQGPAPVNPWARIFRYL